MVASLSMWDNLIRVWWTACWLTNQLWNFGDGLAGLAFALAGGCPGRQLFLSEKEH